MSGEVFDVHEVRTVMEQVRAEGMPEDVGCELLGDAGLVLQIDEEPGDVLALENPDVTNNAG